MATEYAPSRRRIARKIASLTVRPFSSSPTAQAAMAAVSDVDSKENPSSSSSCLRAAALTRLPLWATKTFTSPRPWNSGWAFSQEADPVVE
jgi:hypothetical protein